MDVIPIVPLPVFIVELLFNVTAPKDAASLLVTTLPAIYTALGAVAVMPPLKILTSFASLPSVSVPVLENVTALVIVQPALMATL